RLDATLLEAAGAAGAELRRGVRVRGLERAKGGWRIAADRPASAASVVLATGKHDLRGFARPGGSNGLIGLKMHFALDHAAAAALAGVVRLFPFRGGYCGLEPIEEGRANLCMVLHRRTFES